MHLQIEIERLEGNPQAYGGPIALRRAYAGRN